MSQVQRLTDQELLHEIERRFEEKNLSIKEMEFMNKKLLDLNQRLAEMDSTKSQFLSLIKNEFNNPISSVLNLISNIVLKKHPEKHDDMVAMMHMEILRLDFQIKNIIAASEIEAGRIENYFSLIDFKNILEDAKAMFVYLVRDKRLTIVFSDTTEGKIYSDSQKIFLILMNLLSNSCEFSHQDTEVKIDIFNDQNSFVIRVSDIGEGILLDNKQLVYNRFAQFNRGTARAQTGLGLGLSVAKGMAEALDGEIDYESVPGERTVFVVKLPIISEELATGASAGSSNEFLFEDFGDAQEI